MTVTHSQRSSLADEQISRSIDLSIGRIDAPAEQGEQDARQAVA
ncbi:MAG TPA: hypothetical protein VGA71_02665 [Actinomycetota bacterium]